MRVHVWATITGVMGIVGAVLVTLLTVQMREPVVLSGYCGRSLFFSQGSDCIRRGRCSVGKCEAKGAVGPAA